MEFTKEQLIKTANAEIAEWEMAIERCPDNAKYHQWLRLAEMALAALTAEPVGEFYEDGPLNWYQISDGDRVPTHRRIPLYRQAPPAPVSVQLG